MLLKVCNNDFKYFFVVLKTFRLSRKEMSLEYIILMISSLEVSAHLQHHYFKWGFAFVLKSSGHFVGTDHPPVKHI